jgi:hypothetical protein
VFLNNQLGQQISISVTKYALAFYFPVYYDVSTLEEVRLLRNYNATVSELFPGQTHLSVPQAHEVTTKEWM